MKKVTITMLILCVCTAVNAQKIKETEVPALVKEKFKSLYPTVAKVKWEKENGAFEASFDKGSSEMSVLIDPAGNLKETEVEISVSALPKGVAAYIAKNYAGYKIGEAAKITDAAGKIVYEAEVKNAGKEMDLIFDESGMFIKEQKD